MFTAARNRAIDAIRRERTRRTFAADLAMYLDSERTLAHTVGEAFGENWIKDDQLRMIFMCCHATLAVEKTLILKTLCGLSVPAIARAVLTTESTINKRLYRTRQALRDARFELPSESETSGARYRSHRPLPAVQRGLPVGRREAHRARAVPGSDAAHQFLVDGSSLANSQTVALLALMCFTAARLDARHERLPP